MQIMNLYCTVVFVINMPSIMSMIVTIIPHGIPMMDVHLMLMILIKTNPQKVWEVLKIDPVINQLNKDFTTQIQKAIAQPSRSQSSLDSIQVTRKSSKELKDLAKQLLLQSKQLNSKEKGSPASSEASINHCPNDSLFQDSQDPYDGYNLDSD